MLGDEIRPFNNHQLDNPAANPDLAETARIVVAAFAGSDTDRILSMLGLEQA